MVSGEQPGDAVLARKRVGCACWVPLPPTLGPLATGSSSLASPFIYSHSGSVFHPAGEHGPLPKPVHLVPPIWRSLIGEAGWYWGLALGLGSPEL